ncbi:hypothetical protein PLANPX_1181 [Lacipirellula parvula]|uniref:Uncharacterized protein n=1 Tax=Lacipirellula parvula TaxID=2650471 RepID=A0A5K7XEZ8_9BACT|nr:hypothetical protein PLANPX_1181 [Lacipirellula parvula]
MNEVRPADASSACFVNHRRLLCVNQAWFQNKNELSVVYDAAARGV